MLLIIKNEFTDARIKSEKFDIDRHISIRTYINIIEKRLIKREGTNK